MKRGICLTIAVLTTLIAALVPGPLNDGPAPAYAQGSPVWIVEYFNNAYLIPPAVVTRQETGNAFNWGSGSPAPGVNADNFSARFATDVTLAAGTYRFYILADDGIKLWIDFPADKRPTIDTYEAPRAGEMLTADVTLTAGSHHIQVDFREMSGDAYLYISWANIATNPTPPNFPVPVPSPAWIAYYFNNHTLAGSPVVALTESSPNHNWGTGAPINGLPADYFSVRWVTYYTLDPGSYTVSVKADDGVRVYVNNTLLIDEWHQSSGQTYSKTFTLGAGTHHFVIEYYEAGGDAFLEYTLTRGATQTAPITGAAATVTASVLNVRNAPSAYTGLVVGRIRRGETYAIVGRNADRTWWQLNINGTMVWAIGRYLDTVNTQNVPVTWVTATPPTVTPVYTGSQCPGFLASRLTIGGQGRVTPGLPNNIRAQPTTGSVSIGQIPAGGVFNVLGGPVCGQSAAWWQVRYAGVTGWTMEGQYNTYWLEPY